MGQTAGGMAASGADGAAPAVPQPKPLAFDDPLDDADVSPEAAAAPAPASGAAAAAGAASPSPWRPFTARWHRRLSRALTHAVGDALLPPLHPIIGDYAPH